MSQIKFVKGDLTNPEGTNPRIIIHCCNDIGAWGSGVVMAISGKWPETKLRYRDWYLGQGTTFDPPFELGETQIIEVEKDLYVANIIGQRGIKYKDNPTPIKYDALSKGLDTVAAFATYKKASIHTCRIGCGRAGGSWPKVEALIRDHLVNKGIQVTVYDL